HLASERVGRVARGARCDTRCETEGGAAMSNPAEVAVEFLEQLRPGGPWVFTAIISDGPTQTITTNDPNEVSAFVCTNDGKRNLYYSINPTKGALKSKAKKQDIVTAEFVHADLDPSDGETPDAAKARYLMALKKHEHASAIIDSGNGIQALWRLEVPVP